MFELIPKPFTQATVINAFEDLLENVSGTKEAFRRLRQELMYIAPERKPYVFDRRVDSPRVK